MRLRRRDISEREQESVLQALEIGMEPVSILRAKLDEAIAVRLRIQHRINAVLAVALIALGLSAWGVVGLRNEVHRNSARIHDSEYAYCALKVGFTSFTTNGSLLFASVLHVPPATIKARVDPALKLVRAIPSSSDCER